MKHVIKMLVTALVSLGLLSAAGNLHAEKWKPDKAKVKKQNGECADTKVKAGDKVKQSKVEPQTKVDPNKVKLNKERQVIKRTGPGPVA